MNPDPAVERILSAIADRESIDWEATFDAAEDEATRRTLAALRTLADVQSLADSPDTWGSLRILETLGRGSFGTVYRALDPTLGLEVALKVPHGGGPNERLLEEGRWLAQLRHPNVVRVYGVDERDGRVGLKMELVPGRSLDRIVRESGPFGPLEATGVGVDVCRALAVVHEAGLVHGDVKAQNIMRDPDGRVVLMDFGSGSAASNGADDALRGTPLYLAPEVMAGGPRTARSDIYALGVTLFFLVTGEFPVEATSLGDIRRALSDGGVASLSSRTMDLPPGFADVVDRAMAVDPGERFATAGDMARALSGVLVAPVGPREGRGPRTNLPPRLTRFVGRRESLEALSALVREHRVVTLTGPGGSGKTRLAVELGARLLDAFPDGVWKIPLAPIRDPADVLSTTARVLDAREQPGESTLDAVIRRIAPARMLVIFDNCEHVTDRVAEVVSEIAARSTHVVALCTSREPLDVEGETTYAVSPLDLPDAAGASSPDGVVASEAAALLVDRIRSVRHDFRVTDANAHAVADICRRLDGLPLALELAAAHARALPVRELARRLDADLAILRSRRVPDPAHHAGLDTSIAWSLDRLPPVERSALAVLARFVGGWSLEAAEPVLEAAIGIERSRVVDLLGALTAKSLVHLVDSHGFSVRYDMLVTVGEYASNFATASDGAIDEDRWRRAFVDHYLDFARTSNGELMGAGDARAMSRLESDRHNTRAAYRLCLAAGDTLTALQIVRYLGRFWMVSARQTPALRIYGELLALPDSHDHPEARADILSWYAVFVKRLDADASRRATAEVLAVRREHGDDRGVAAALNGLAVLDYDAGRYARARARHLESLALRRALGEERGVAQSLTNLGLCAEAEERLDDAAACFEEALAIHRRRENTWGIAKALGDLGHIRALTGDLMTGRRLLEEAIDIQRDLGPEVAFTIHLGFVHLSATRFDEARGCFEHALNVMRDSGDGLPPSEAIRGLAFVALRTDAHRDAVRLFGASEAQRHVQLNPRRQRETDAAIAELRRTLGDDEFERAWREGVTERSELLK